LLILKIIEIENPNAKKRPKEAKAIVEKKESSCGN
jgi:hypothetical protein